MKKIVLILLAMVMLSGCVRTISYPQMQSDQAELIRNNWESVKIGMSKAQVTDLLGQPSTYRMNYTTENEKLWYVFTSTNDLNKHFSIYVFFRDGKLEQGSITGGTLSDTRGGYDSQQKARQLKGVESLPPDAGKPEKPITSTPIAPSSGTTTVVTVTWTSANIRSGAGNEFPVLMIANKGDKLTIIGERGEWFNVRLENGKEGWINSRAVGTQF